VAVPDDGRAVLATWRMLLDDGRGQDGEPHLAATARTPVARLAPQDADALGLAEGDLVEVTTDRGSVSLPLVVTALPPGVVWLPQQSPGSHLARMLGAGFGAVVSVGAGSRPDAPNGGTS
jgi:NADH-quinone oxidoreductase subunit G